MAVSGACPNCGAPIEFTAARSVVTVCDNCETVVGRVGEAFENFGKVAELVRMLTTAQTEPVSYTHLTLPTNREV